MSTVTAYYIGGYESSAPAQNKSEQWTNATQPTDPTPAGYTAWDTSGNVITSRALTTAEAAALANQDSDLTAMSNLSTLQSKAQTAISNNKTFLAITSPTSAEAIARVQALTRQVNALIYVFLDALQDISGA